VGYPRPDETKTPELAFAAESFDGGRLLSVEGELDLSTVDQLLAEAQVVLETPGSLTVDLSGCAFVDSSGIQGLLALRRACDGDGRGFALIAQGQPARVLGIASLDRALNLAASRDEALAALSASGGTGTSS
jgi:anti-sigma B factor antagonist